MRTLKSKKFSIETVDDEEMNTPKMARSIERTRNNMLSPISQRSSKIDGLLTQNSQQLSNKKTIKEKQKLEQEILNNVSKLFKDYYQDHGDLQTQRQMELVRERDKRRLKLQMKLLNLKYQTHDIQRMFQNQNGGNKDLKLLSQYVESRNPRSPSSQAYSQYYAFSPKSVNNQINIFSTTVYNSHDQPIPITKFQPSINETNSSQNDLLNSWIAFDKNSFEHYERRSQERTNFITAIPEVSQQISKEAIKLKKSELFQNLGIKQGINDKHYSKNQRQIESTTKYSPNKQIYSHSARQIGMSNEKLLNLKQLSNLKSLRNYSPIIDDLKVLKFLKHNNNEDDIATLRTRTFNTKLISRKVKNQQIDSMLITDYNVINEPRFLQFLIMQLHKSYGQTLAELSAKLFNNNEISWISFTKQLKINQIRPINLLFEEIIGITIQIGISMLLNFKDNPEKIGINDP